MYNFFRFNKDEEQRALLVRARKVALSAIQRNIVFKDNQPYAIDFGRCGYGYYLYDMAGTILELWPKHRWMLIQGYESIKKLETDYIQELECFFIMFMIENYCHHASDPRETAGLIAEQKYAQAYIREYMKGNPFLFQVIK